MAHVPVVSDKMKYGLKPIGVESKTHVLSLPCVGTNRYEGNTSSNIVFRIQHNPSGRFVDPTATRIKLTFTMSWPAALTRSVHAFFFERGPESIIRRFQIRDIQGRVLEDIDNYNLVYAITEICTNESNTRQRRGTFHMEGNSSYPDLGGWIKHPTMGLQNGLGPNTSTTFDLTFTPFSAVFGGACEKYIPLSVMEGMEIHLQLENIQSCIGYKLIPQDAGAGTDRDPVTLLPTGAAPNRYTLADFNYNTSRPKLANFLTPMSHRQRRDAAVSNGIATIICDGIPNVVEWSNRDPANADQDLLTDDTTEGNYKWNLTLTYRNLLSYTITDPKLLISCLDVEPAVNTALINAAKDPRDGMIRIQTFSWSTYTTQINQSNAGLFSWQIPVSVTSMKSIFFTFTDQTKRENMNYLRSGFEHRGLLRYRILIGGLPLNADWVEVGKGDSVKFDTYSESIGTLLEAWSVHHKSDGNPTLLTLENYAPARFSDSDYGMYQKEYNAVFGQELESFTQKSGIIQSGINTMQTTFVLELEFGQNTRSINVAPAATENCILYKTGSPYELRAYVMYDKVIAFDETSGSIRAEY
jgi:hypothetical protein